MTLSDFYEPEKEKPLINGAIVQSDRGKYRTERWFSAKGHCYVFIDIALNSNKPPFAQKPSQVTQAIESKKIIVVKNGTEQFFN